MLRHIQAADASDWTEQPSQRQQLYTLPLGILHRKAVRKP